MIPKIIHHIAPNDKNRWHLIWNECYPSWKEHFPKNEYEHILWNDENDIDNLIGKYFPDFFKIYESFPHHIFKIDFAKFCILYQYGGIYADMDYICFKNFYNNLEKNLCIVESASKNELLQNSLMASIKKNKHLFEIIEKIKYNYYYNLIMNLDIEKNVLPIENVLTITGPMFLSDYYNQLDKIDKNKIQILDQKIYNPRVEVPNDETLFSRHFLTGMWGKETIQEWIDGCGIDNFKYKILEDYGRIKGNNFKEHFAI